MSNRSRIVSTQIPSALQNPSKSDYPDGNPKSVAARGKPGIKAIPAVPMLHLGLAMEDGRRKYGLMNWRGNSVAASVYYEAAWRHLMLWYDAREQVADDSKVHHLGHAMACLAIILDAEASGNLIDDRPEIPGPFADVLKQMLKETELRPTASLQK